MAKGRNRTGAKARRLGAADLAGMMSALEPWTDPVAWFDKPARERLFDPATVFWLFLSQMFSPDGSCREAVQTFLARLALTRGKEASASTAAYCKARARLPLERVKRASQDVARKIQQSPLAQSQWCGRHVKVVDGTGVSMPDTPENQKKYPQSSTRKAGCGFPEMRIVALFSLATGVWLRSAQGSRHVAERTLFRSLWDHLERLDVLLADRGFCGFADFYSLLERGVDCVMRLHQRRTVGLRIVKRLGRGDTLVQWIKTKVRPKWLTQEEWAALPDVLDLRHVTFTVDIAGFRSRDITVATTLTDAVQFPPSAIAELYRRRWNVELYFRDIKIALGMDVLRCRTPKRVEKELAMRIIAYNLIRATLLQAAHAVQREPDRISFKGTCQALRQWESALNHASPQQRQDLYRAMLNAIARVPLPYRPDRTEPRAKKRRPKNYQLLTQPRHAFKESPHRNHYKAAP